MSMQYTRDELKSIAGAFIVWLGYATTDTDKPIRVLKSMSDLDLQNHIIAAMEASRDAGWVTKAGDQQDIADADDIVLSFVYDNGIIVLPDDTDMEETEELGGDEEELESGTSTEEKSSVNEDDDLARIEQELAELEASGITTEETVIHDFPMEEPDIVLTDAPIKNTDVDKKVSVLAAEQAVSDPEDVFARYAPVTIQNVEAAVLAIAKLLSQGKVVVISAHDVGSVPVCGHTKETVVLPTAVKATTELPTLEQYVESMVAKHDADMRARLNSALKTLEHRRAFCRDNNVTLKRGIKLEDASDRMLFNAILEWEVKRTDAVARAKYAKQIMI